MPVDATWIDKAMIYGPLGLFALFVIWGVREAWFALWQAMFRSPSRDEHGGIDHGGYVTRFFTKAIEGIDANTEANKAISDTVTVISKKIDAVLDGRGCKNYSPDNNTGGSGIHGGRQ
jgi:hypothetical protein